MLQQIINQLNIETMFSIALIVYLTRIFVKMAYSLIGQLFWLGFSLVGIYNIITENIHILSGYSIMMITIFLSIIFPISKHFLNLFRKGKKVLFRCKPSNLPRYEQKFGLPPEQLQMMKDKHALEQEQKSIQTKYMNKLLEKLNKI